METFDIVGYLIKSAPLAALMIWVYTGQRKDHKEAMTEKDNRIKELNNEYREDQKANRDLLVELKGLMAILNEKMK